MNSIRALISGDFGSGKSCLGLDFSRFIQGDLLTLDYERGQDYYLVGQKEDADPKNLLYFAYRLVTPSLYEVRYIVEALRTKKLPQKIDHKPVNAALLSSTVQEFTEKAVTGKVQVGGLLIDTVTRLCDLTAAATFDECIDKADKSNKDGLAIAEKMSQLLWAKAKDRISDVLFKLIETDIPFVLTAWVKNRFDRETLKSTNELITDVLKNVRAFVDLEILLQPEDGFPVKAQVMKSRLSKPGNPMPKLITATWEEVFKYTSPVRTRVPVIPDTKPVPGASRGAPAKQAEGLTCARCEGAILDFVALSGKPYTAQELITKSKKKFNQPLCANCYVASVDLQKAAAEAVNTEVKAEFIKEEKP